MARPSIRRLQSRKASKASAVARGSYHEFGPAIELGPSIRLVATEARYSKLREAASKELTAWNSRQRLDPAGCFLASLKCICQVVEHPITTAHRSASGTVLVPLDISRFISSFKISAWASHPHTAQILRAVGLGVTVTARTAGQMLQRVITADAVTKARRLPRVLMNDLLIGQLRQALVDTGTLVLADAQSTCDVVGTAGLFDDHRCPTRTAFSISLRMLSSLTAEAAPVSGVKRSRSEAHLRSVVRSDPPATGDAHTALLPARALGIPAAAEPSSGDLVRDVRDEMTQLLANPARSSRIAKYDTGCQRALFLTDIPSNTLLDVDLGGLATHAHVVLTNLPEGRGGGAVGGCAAGRRGMHDIDSEQFDSILRSASGLHDSVGVYTSTGKPEKRCPSTGRDRALGATAPIPYDPRRKQVLALYRPIIAGVRAGANADHALKEDSLALGFAGRRFYGCAGLTNAASRRFGERENSHLRLVYPFKAGLPELVLIQTAAIGDREEVCTSYGGAAARISGVSDAPPAAAFGLRRSPRDSHLPATAVVGRLSTDERPQRAHSSDELPIL